MSTPKNLFIATSILTIFLLAFPLHTAHEPLLPTPSVQLTTCHAIQNAVTVNAYAKNSLRWKGAKILLALLTGAITTFALSPFDPEIKVKRTLQQANEVHRRGRAAFAEVMAHARGLPPPQERSTPLPPIPYFTLQPTFFSLTIATLASIIAYHTISNCYDAKIFTAQDVLVDFLEQWPIFSITAPETLKKELDALCAAYHEKGITLFPSNEIAQTILTAIDLLALQESERLTG